jgi:transposase-like protein
MRARRTFDEKFKRQVVESVLSGSISQVELSRKYAISPLLISRWKKEYKQGKFFENNMDITRFELKLHELERVVGELTMENRMLRQVVELVEKEKKEESLIVTSRGYKMSKKDVK